MAKVWGATVFPNWQYGPRRIDGLIQHTAASEVPVVPAWSRPVTRLFSFCWMQLWALPETYGKCNGSLVFLFVPVCSLFPDSWPYRQFWLTLNAEPQLYKTWGWGILDTPSHVLRWINPKRMNQATMDIANSNLCDCSGNFQLVWSQKLLLAISLIAWHSLVLFTWKCVQTLSVFLFTCWQNV